MQHIEFFHRDHFKDNYFRASPGGELAGFIDFFWQTKFEDLWEQYPSGFSDMLFPNVGYTYLINLGTPFRMQVGDKSFDMKGDGFLPRHQAIECHHREGNCLFGIKFRISPVLLMKKINFGEYREFIYPLSYLMEQEVIDQVKRSGDFDQRVKLLVKYFQALIDLYDGPAETTRIVSSILSYCEKANDFNSTVESFAMQYRVSSRTLHRYFESATSLSIKKAIQILRIRKAVSHMIESPDDFNYTLYGYYDHSHFYKHLRQFLQKKTFKTFQSRLRLQR